MVALTLGALVNGATFCSFTYLAPILTNVTGFAVGWVPVMLALFGLGSFAGVSIGGRIADVRPHALLAVGGYGLLVGWAVLALTAENPLVTAVLVFGLGAFAFGTGSTLVSRVLYLATEAPTLGGGFATAALNVGAAVGPWLGGLALATGLGFGSPLWISALLMALAVVLSAIVRARV